MNRYLFSGWIFVISLVFVSCSGNDYLNAIPKNSTALVSVDMSRIAGERKGVNESLMKAWFHVSDPSDCGIDMSAKVYLFEAPDGHLGMVAKVKDDDNIIDWLNTMAKQGRCQKVQNRRGYHFTILNKSWVVGFNEAAFLIMGPVVSVEQAELMRKMMKYLEAEEGIMDSPLFAKLNEIDSSVAMVSQAQALPEQFIAPFTIGAPANTPPDKVLVAAGMKVEDGCLLIEGETFSFDEKIDSALKSVSHIYRPVTGVFLDQIPAEATYGLLMNVDGDQMLPLMKQSDAFRAMLTGMSVKIDIDGFMQRINGDLLMVVPSASNGQMQMQWAAQMKSGVPPLDADSEAELARCRLTLPTRKLPEKIRNSMKQVHMCMFINLSGVEGEKKTVTDAFTSLLKPIFGEVKYILYQS